MASPILPPWARPPGPPARSLWRSTGRRTPPSWPRGRPRGTSRRSTRGTSEGFCATPTPVCGPDPMALRTDPPSRTVLPRHTHQRLRTRTHDTVRTFLRRFRQEGMGLPTDIEVAPRPRASRVPEAVRQEMARLKALHNDFQYREIVRIIFYKCGYRLHPKTASGSGSRASRPSKQLALGDYHSQGDRYQARVQVIKLYYQGWTKRSISRSSTSPARPSIGGFTALKRSTSRGWWTRASPQGSPESLVATHAGGLSPPKAPSGCGGVSHLESARQLGDIRAHRGAHHGPQPAGL